MECGHGHGQIWGRHGQCHPEMRQGRRGPVMSSVIGAEPIRSRGGSWASSVAVRTANHRQENHHRHHETRAPAPSSGKQQNAFHFDSLVLILRSVFFFSLFTAQFSAFWQNSLLQSQSQSRSQSHKTKQNKPSWKHYSPSPSTISLPTTREKSARDCARSTAYSQKYAFPLPRPRRGADR